MTKKIITLLILFCAYGSVQAALYTNTWVNTEGVSVVKNFGDAANWSVVYEPGVAAPSSSIPNADSRVHMKTSASITLQSGDDYHLGPTFFLALGTRDKTLNLTIPAGASLSLDGSGNTSYMGTSGWVDGSSNNRTTIDVNGGSLTLGQSVFNMRGNTSEAWYSAPVNHIKVRNGGTMSVTNGYVRLWGGSSPLSDGKGLYTNIIDILQGSTLNLTGKGRIAFSTSHDDIDSHYDSPWTLNYYGGGWVNVKGGKILVKDSTTPYPIVINGHPDASMGQSLNVTDEGLIDLGGKAIFVGSRTTGAPVEINVTGGGVITNGALSVQDGPRDFDNRSCIDIDNGTMFLNQFSFGTASGLVYGRLTIRIHGSDSVFTCSGWSIHHSTPYPPIFADMRLKAHTDRNADFAIRPIRTRTAPYDSGGGYNIFALGYWRLSPDGGLQLVHTDSFELLCRKHDSQGEYKFGDMYGGLIGDDMWQTNCLTMKEDRWKKYTTYDYAYVFRVLLKDEARLMDGTALEHPKPRAWFRLPKFTAKDIDPERTERISVRIGLDAPQGGELDLDAVIAKMCSEGGQDAYKDESVAGYNVRVDLPLDELMANTTDDKIVMDFVSCENYGQAAGLQPMTTNALIRVVTCEKVLIYEPTLVILK